MKFCGECAAPLAATCPSCGAANPPENKFCGQCAAPLRTSPTAKFAAPDSYTPKYLAERILTSKAALEGERKQVTVLFADLKGSMELLADRDPEEARKLLDPVLEHMMEAVHRYEGTVNQVMGDGILGPRDRERLVPPATTDAAAASVGTKAAGLLGEEGISPQGAYLIGTRGAAWWSVQRA
jgi:class 3 adenylate cyclase